MIKKRTLKVKTPKKYWLAGGIGVKWDGTWTTANLSEKAGFELDFIGIPGGRTVITNDLLGLSKSTKHAKEAFDSQNGCHSVKKAL